MQAQWYFDEIIVIDSLVVSLDLHQNSENLEGKKKNLVDYLRMLNKFKDSINSGQILFISYDFQSPINHIAFPELDHQSLICEKELRQELLKLPHVYKMTSPAEPKSENYNIRILYRNAHILFPIIKSFENLTGLTYDFIGSDYLQLMLPDIERLGIEQNVFEGCQHLFIDEVLHTLNCFSDSIHLNTSPMFTRPIDAMILSKAGKNLDNKGIETYNLTLPFLDNIPATRLYELRMKMPSAFYDFRNEMFVITHDLKNRGFDRGELKIRVEQKVNPIIKSLEGEIKSALTNLGLMSIGAPIISGSAIYGLSSFGIGSSSITNAFLTSGITLVGIANAVSSTLKTRNTVKSNPLYFLWQTKK
ncbi:MAG: hypothetical protein JST76_00005 [Bacteroidetes bacterium]|nr:hypothetical protein [Bacteroidota bacterium]